MDEVPVSAVRSWAEGNRSGRIYSWPSAVYVRCPQCRESQVFHLSTDVAAVLGRRPVAMRCAAELCKQAIDFFITDLGIKADPWKGRLWMHPSLPRRTPLPVQGHLSDHLIAEYHDALDLLADGKNRPAATYARLMLEQVVRRETNAPDRANLAALIRQLPDHVNLAQPIMEVAEILREGGNLAAHFEEGRPIGHEVAEGMIGLLEAFIEYLILLPERVVDLRNNLEHQTQDDAP